MSKISELKWQAESDAETMARYQEILNDKPRLNRAIKMANTKAKSLSERANCMERAAKYSKGGKLKR